MILGSILLLLGCTATVAYTPSPHPTRRTFVANSASAAAASIPAAALAAKSRDDGYAVQRPDREWAYTLSGQQYFILRQGGTEAPNSSPLVKEKRLGSFACAGCDTPLFESKMKFDSGTGWPSFAAPLAGVEVLDSNPLKQALLGVEVRCGTCGGHLGDVFADGLLFPGTPAALTGKRYCIDGAALVFKPADGSPIVLGEGEVKEPELPSWLQPPKVGGAGGAGGYGVTVN